MPPRAELKVLTPYQRYIEHWGKGCGTSECSKAFKLCHVRGQLPCDVFFVGEAPGESENALGYPFVGPAGQLLDDIVNRAIGGMMLGAGSLTEDDVSNGELIRCAFTNLVSCIPRDDDGYKAHTPSVECIMACAPRLQELLNMGGQRLVVGVGKLPEDWLRPGYKNPVILPAGNKFIRIDHPAFILRQNVVQRAFLAQQAVVKLRGAVMDAMELPVTESRQPARTGPVRDEDIPF